MSYYSLFEISHWKL